MYGFIAAAGPAARALTERQIADAWPADAVSEVIRPHDDVLVARFAPRTGGNAPGFASSDDGRVIVYVDGYLYLSTAPRHASRAEQARALANECRRAGYEAALACIEGGTFNLVVIDLDRIQVWATNDPVSALPLYRAPVEGSLLVSNNPVALARTGLVDTTPDMTAMAEWAYIGYTLGERFMVRGIRIVAPWTSVAWDRGASQATVRENAGSPWRLLPEGRGPTPDDLADQFIESCARIALLEPSPAQFQSAGKDSRLILAAWPEGRALPCYTYGDERSHEVTIARELAKVRGSDRKRVWLDGDAMAPSIPKLFECTGLFVYPDRYFSARTIRADGLNAVLDGYLGGATIGGSFLDGDQYFSRFAKAMRLLTVYVDQKASRIGVEKISAAMLDSILDVRSDDALRQFLREDFVAALRAEWPRLVADLEAEVRRFMPANDSLAALWNNVVLANRSVHAICQQMALVRSYVDVYCPFSGDVPLLRMQWQLPPRSAAYKRTYIHMYRKRFPRYGAVPYGWTLLPLNRPALQHKWSSILTSRGIVVPGITGDPRGRPRDATGWGLWLGQSALVRDAAADALREGGIIDEHRAGATFGAMRDGTRKATGKVFHYAAMSKWLAMAGA